MNAIYKILIPFLFPALLLSACEEDTVIEGTAGTPVLNGYLYGGQPVDSIRITLTNTYDGNDSSLISLDDLAVEIETGDDSYLLESIGNGYYRLPSLIVDYEQSYTISFVYAGKTIRAETYVPLQRTITISTSSIYLEQITGFGGPGGIGGANAVDPIEISWDNSEGDYYFVVIQNLETDPEYINLLLLQLLAENEDAPRFSRITEPTITDFHGIDVRRELQQFGTHRAIVYRVNAEYAALYESSGTSSVSITSPPTNIDNGFGIFSGISGDTVLFNVEKL